MGFFDLIRIGAPALLLLPACAAVPLVHAVKPPDPYWPPAVIDNQGQAKFEIVDQDSPQAIELLPRHASNSTACVLNGINWALRLNHRGLVSQEVKSRKIALPARPAHGLSCNGRFIAIDAIVDSRTVMWVIDAETGRQEKTVLPVLKNGYARVFPVIDAHGDLVYSLALSYTGPILAVNGGRIDHLPIVELPIHSYVDLTQYGDSLLVQTDYVYVISAADRRLRGSLDLSGNRTWIRPTENPKLQSAVVAAVDFHGRNEVAKPEVELVSPAAFFDGDPLTEGFLAQGNHTFAIRFIRPVLVSSLHLVEPVTPSSARITNAQAGFSYHAIAVYGRGGSVFPTEKISEATPPNLLQIATEMQVILTCECQEKRTSCEDLCTVGEIQF